MHLDWVWANKNDELVTEGIGFAISSYPEWERFLEISPVFNVFFRLRPHGLGLLKYIQWLKINWKG